MHKKQKKLVKIYNKYVKAKYKYLKELKKVGYLDIPLKTLPNYYMFKNIENNEWVEHMYNYYKNYKSGKTTETEKKFRTWYACYKEQSKVVHYRKKLIKLCKKDTGRKIFLKVYGKILKSESLRSKKKFKKLGKQLDKIMKEMHSGGIWEDDYCGRCNDKYRPYEIETYESICPQCLPDVENIGVRMQKLLID